jgi:tetratricopeptide (TPR) repeat protein
MRSKKLVLSVLTMCLLSSAMVFAQDESTQTETADPNEKPAIYWLYDNVYRNASKNNDFQSATVALYSLIALEPQNDSLRFNLAYLYFDAQRYPSAVLASRDVLQLNPNHAGALEIGGYSYEALGIPDQSLASFEKLYMITENVETLYKVAFLQYDLKRFAECITNVDILLENPEIDSITMSFQLSEEVSKDFTLRVATLNLKGLVNEEMGDKDAARKAYNDALALAPDFVFATTNLEKLGN